MKTPTDTPTNTPTSTPPPAFEGCTPGFWKQEQHFDSWAGFTMNQTLESVFEVPDSFGLDNATLLQALSFKGGPTTTQAANLAADHGRSHRGCQCRAGQQRPEHNPGAGDGARQRQQPGLHVELIFVPVA
jgi:hypothetical protein